ncbi:hypothetical protein ACFX2J_001526 [Malus domestica]
MAVAAAYRRVAQLGTGSGIRLSSFGGPSGASRMVSPSVEYMHLDCRLTSQLIKSNGKQLFLVGLEYFETTIRPTRKAKIKNVRRYDADHSVLKVTYTGWASREGDDEAAAFVHRHEQKQKQSNHAISSALKEPRAPPRPREPLPRCFLFLSRLPLLPLIMSSNDISKA